MVSFNHNDLQSFPLPLGSTHNRNTSKLLVCKFQRIDQFLQNISVAWGRLLQSASEVFSITCQGNSCQDVVNTHSDLSRLIVSVLNQCQLMIWMYETKAETITQSAKSANELMQIKESIGRELDQLCQMVGASAVQSQFCRRVVVLVEQLT